jgi:hypothetical protein
MTNGSQDPGKNQKSGSSSKSSTSSTCCYVYAVRQGKLSPRSEPDKLALFLEPSNDFRLQISNLPRRLSVKGSDGLVFWIHYR